MKFPMFDLSSGGRTSSTAVPGRGRFGAAASREAWTEPGGVQVVSPAAGAQFWF